MVLTISGLFFVVAGATDTKVSRSTRVPTANSTNKYQKYKSVELGNQLGLGGHIFGLYKFLLQFFGITYFFAAHQFSSNLFNAEFGGKHHFRVSYHFHGGPVKLI